MAPIVPVLCWRIGWNVKPVSADGLGINARWFILAMGKLGAGELNFSSDIDLIVLYDSDADDAEKRAGFCRYGAGIHANYGQTYGARHRLACGFSSAPPTLASPPLPCAWIMP